MKDKNQKIRILYYEPSSGYGGSSRCLLSWLTYIDKDKFEPLLIARSNGPSIKKIKKLGIKTIRIPYISLLKWLLPLHNNIISYLILFEEIIFNIMPVALIIAVIAKVKKINLIDLNSSIINVMPAILASKLATIPTVCHIHDTRKLTKIENFFGKFVDVFIVLTNYAVKSYSSELRQKKILLVFNGLNVDEMKILSPGMDIREEFKLNHKNILVGLVGRIVHGKGHIDFIKAANIIKDFNQGIIFLIVGSSDSQHIQLERQLRDLVKSFGLEKDVIFTGWREDIKKVMMNLDIVVQASTTFPEGFGLTSIEAMSFGKPVVATDIPGSAETVLNNVTGFLVPPAQPHILAEKILILVNNPELRSKMGKAGLERVEKLFNIVTQTKSIEEIYKKYYK